MAAQNYTNPTGELTLSQAADYLPRKASGQKVHVRTIQRWIEKGCRGVILEGRRAGNVWYTSRSAIDQFRSAGTATRVSQQSIAIPSSMEMKRVRQAVAARLHAKGFKTNVQDQEAARRALEKAGLQAVPLTP